MPKLQITLPDGADFTHELVEDTVTVGRAPDNALEIADISVSSHHAQLVLSGGDYVLTDIGSTNGTKLNGKRVNPNEEHPLQNGDTITFGNIDAAYSSEVPAEPRPMPAEEQHETAVAESSVLPANFANASPFESKKKKKDPAGVAILALGVVAILVFVGAIVSVFGMKSPL